MVSENEEVHTEKVASEGSDTPHDASGFEFPRGPILLIVEGGSADVDDGAYGAIWLFLFEGGAESVIGANAICQDDVTQKVNTCGTNPGFIRGELEFMEA